MTLAPIQLRAFVYERVALETQTRALPDEAEPRPPSLHFDTEWESSPTAEADGVLRLTVAVNQDRDDWRMYRGEVAVVGFFAWLDPDTEVDRETVERYYLMSGFSILYGLVRAFAVQLSATAPHPQLLLPSFDFTPAVDHLLEREDDAEGAAQPE